MLVRAIFNMVCTQGNKRENFVFEALFSMKTLSTAVWMHSRETSYLLATGCSESSWSNELQEIIRAEGENSGIRLIEKAAESLLSEAVKTAKLKAPWLPQSMFNVDLMSTAIVTDEDDLLIGLKQSLGKTVDADSIMKEVITVIGRVDAPQNAIGGW